MLNYLKKFAVDIFPSVAATVIGAYIVNHYIVSRPTDVPPPAAVSAPKSDGKAEAKVEDAAAAVSNLPPAGVKAKGISEKSITEKGATEKAVVDKAEAKADVKPDANRSEASKSEVKSTESPADGDRRHVATPREKEKIRVILPSPIQPVNEPANTASTPAVVPAPVVAAAPAAPVDPAPAVEERRDANDLARAAIERLRANGDIAPRAVEPPRTAEPPRAAETVRVPESPKVAHAPAMTNTPAPAAPAVRPLPPPIMVSGAPAGEPFGQPAPPVRAPYVEARDPNRPVPPADIPLSRPIDLRAEAGEPSVRERAANAAEDALSTAKSIFHSVLPK